MNNAALVPVNTNMHKPFSKACLWTSAPRKSRKNLNSISVLLTSVSKPIPTQIPSGPSMLYLVKKLWIWRESYVVSLYQRLLYHEEKMWKLELEFVFWRDKRVRFTTFMVQKVRRCNTKYVTCTKVYKGKLKYRNEIPFLKTFFRNTVCTIFF